MRARMLALLGWFRHRPGNASRPKGRTGRRPSPFDSLERREVLSSATFVPFATFSGQVATGGTTTAIPVDFNAGQVTSTGSASVLVGFYVQAATGSTATPQVAEVDGPAGVLTRVALPKRGGISPSKSLFITYLEASPSAAEDLTVKVVEPGKQTGSFTLEAFLPGDANGDGTVNATDLALVQASYGTALGQANNNPAADFNADGHVGCIDLHLTQLNQGASVSYGTPVALATSVVLPSTTPASVVVTAPVSYAATTTTSATPVIQYVPVLTYPSSTNGTVATTAAAGTTTPAYYSYGQPVAQVPAYSYGQPVAQVATTAQAATPTPAYYYGQPVVQGPTATQGYATAPAYSYYGQPVAAASTVPVTYSAVPVPTTTTRSTA